MVSRHTIVTETAEDFWKARPELPKLITYYCCYSTVCTRSRKSMLTSTQTVFRTGTVRDFHPRLGCHGRYILGVERCALLETELFADNHCFVVAPVIWTDRDPSPIVVYLNPAQVPEDVVGGYCHGQSNHVICENNSGILWNNANTSFNSYFLRFKCFRHAV